MKKKIKENHKCTDCGIGLIMDKDEFVCPKCGLVEEFIYGSE